MTFPDRLATNFELVKQVPSNKPFDVFLVKDRTKDLRPCVLRLLPASLSGDKAIVDAFMAYFSKFSEIINRAYIPTVYSVSGQPGGNVYVLEEHVSGTDLKKFIQKNRATSGFNKEIIGVVGKTCEAIHHAHQKDLFHLAITLEDILIDESAGRVKLVGFGVQVFAQVNKTGLLSDQAKKTIAPEVLEGGALRPNADIYSLAKAINEACPEVFSTTDVLSKALSNNPPDRYQQARDFEGALSDVLEKISKAARSRNIDTPLEAKGGLKPVLTEKPVTVEREVYQSPPRKPNTPQSQPQIKPDSVPVTPEPETPKSISMKLVAAIAAGVLAIVIGLAFYFSHEKQSLQKEREIAAQKDAQKIAALEKDRTDKDRQAAIEKERLEKELESARIKEAERLAAVEKEKLEKEQELPAFAWNYPEELKNLLRRAIRGDAEAEFQMGLKYDKGEGVPKDLAEAVKWYLKAGARGHEKAQFNLGGSYKNGEGVSKDDAQAVNWYRKAAEQGNAIAQFHLGVYYWKGKGVPKDNSEAAHWFRKSSDQNYVYAQYIMGTMYSDGCGVSKDYSEAVKWWLKAADQGHAGAQFDLGACYRNGQGVPKDDYEAINWFRKAADQGDAQAQYAVGVVYGKGHGVSKDDHESVKWFRKAADQGHAMAQANLGACYYEGRGVSKDYYEAARWYRKAADQGIADVQVLLASMYASGRGVQKDRSEAIKWYRKAADQGHQMAKDKLRDMGVSQ